ncbi:hypothetical protein GCM10009759_45610 [Kitasatospora saccharophila]|uniref:Carrier domain-containing protein n=2 Tax=Kitasatospora saccharophila TaxID=407973 RepID=A0ABN2X817_9ACTN
MSVPLKSTHESETLTALFARSAAAHANRPAVSDDTHSLTYAELDRRSDALAEQLRDRGIRTEDRIALYLDRSVDVFVAILGILKAGGCYVAVDTRYPDSRRDRMIADSGARLVVTRPEWDDRIGHLGVPALPFRSGPFEPGTATLQTEPQPSAVRPENAASVLFTSGSSGTPKAIVLEHRNIISFACNEDLPVLRPEEDRTGQISSLSFDAFHFEMWSTLAQGAEVHVLPPVPELLAAGFQREMRRRRITAMLVPTMVVNHVVREDRDAFSPLRILLTGGDVLLPATCRDLLAGQFEGELYNLYGPAEITTACTFQRVTAAETELDSVPIGRPLACVTVHVLSPTMEPVAQGEVGEMYVGGPGVARGYLGRPDLTDERFVTSPFPSGPSRLYRTGDLARQDEDSRLEFIGRTDCQVKIRGYRVEPGEVERGLRRHPGVPEAVVLASGDGDNRHLVAFVVMASGLTIRELRQHAAAELPDFMVPAHFVAVSAIPEGEHGKRDQAALAEMLEQHRLRQKSFDAPTTDSERYLAELWERLFGIEHVSRNDDFFVLGGHSLLAFRMQSQIRRGRGIALEAGIVLRNSILADLARALDEAAEGGALI